VISSSDALADISDGPDSLEAKDYVATIAWEAIAPGFQRKSDVLKSVVEMVDDDDDLAMTPSHAADVVEQLWARRIRQLEEPATFPTDDEKVSAAFAALNASGVLARMNLEWDQDEANASARRLAAAAGAHGFAFFHGQDAARLAYPQATLWLGFDLLDESCPDYESAAVQVGEEIRNALVSQNLEVHWNGTARKRIAVVNLDWRQQLPDS
jgi:hypothetical protein